MRIGFTTVKKYIYDLLRAVSNYLEKDLVMMVYLLIIGFVKFAMSSNLAVLIYPTEGYDDVLMSRLAENLYNGNWLGNYDNLTLVKAWFFSLFVAGCRYIGISYLDAQIVLQILGVTLFCIACCGLFKAHRKIIYIMYPLLLFCPIFHSAWTFQRMYRSGLVPIFEYFVLAGYIAIYSSEKEYKGILKSNAIFWCVWMLISGLAFNAMWLTKEDSIWIVPFMVVASISAIIKWIVGNIDNVRDNIKQVIVCAVIRGLIVAIPFVCLWGTSSIIKRKNNEYYGIDVVTDTSGTNFARVMNLLYAIEDDYEQPYVSVSYEKLQKLYEVSPTFATVKNELNYGYLEGDICDRNVGDQELEDGWFYWVLRASVARAGYYKDANTSEMFYGKVADELQQAIDDGKLSCRATMPSSLMSPWKEGYLENLVSTLFVANDYVISYQDIMSVGPPSNAGQSVTAVDYMGAQTNNVIVYPMDEEISINGWILWKGQEKVDIELRSNDGTAQKLVLQPSIDVTNSQFGQLNPEMSTNCRFSDNLTISKSSNLSVCILSKNGEVLHEVPVGVENLNYEDDKCLMIIDEYSRISTQDEIVKAENRYASRLNRINNLYQKFGKVLFYTMLLSYLIVGCAYFIYMIKGRKKNEKDVISDKWCVVGKCLLVCLGLLLSYLLILGGISYTDISAYGAIRYMYLVAAYPLVISFDCIVFGLLCFLMINKLKDKFGNKEGK